MKKSIFCTNDFVNIEDLDNSQDFFKNLGNVNYKYRISKYLITNEKFIFYLNDIDNNLFNKTDCYDDRCGIEWNKKFYVKNDFEKKPIAFINPKIAKKFCNYIYNIENNLNLETESCYYLNSNKRISSKGYFLPNLNEWHKAAFYNGKTYNIYPIKNNLSPIYCKAKENKIINPNINTINFNNAFDYNEYNGFISNVGDCGSHSEYGVYDMAGNLHELIIDEKEYLAGGSWHSWRTSLKNGEYFEYDPLKYFGSTIGLRLIKID